MQQQQQQPAIQLPDSMNGAFWWPKKVENKGPTWYDMTDRIYTSLKRSEHIRETLGCESITQHSTVQIKV